MGTVWPDGRDRFDRSRDDLPFQETDPADPPVRFQYVADAYNLTKNGVKNKGGGCQIQLLYGDAAI